MQIPRAIEKAAHAVASESSSFAVVKESVPTIARSRGNSRTSAKTCGKSDAPHTSRRSRPVTCVWKLRIARGPTTPQIACAIRPSTAPRTSDAAMYEPMLAVVLISRSPRSAPSFNHSIIKPAPPIAAST
jgi:hypothetical protein